MKHLLPFVGIIVTLIAAVGMALAGNQHGLSVGTIPLFGLCIAIAFLMQWIAFIPAFIKQTERFFDLTGGVTYLTVVAIAYTFGNQDNRSLLLAVLISIWAVRLSLFLFRRVREDGEDKRFRSIKPHFPTFLMTWTIQGLWVSLTAACALASMTSSLDAPLGGFAVVGSLLWLTGMTIEVIADQQKRTFRSKPENRNGFINTGLWAWSRHPNYFGEILLWSGVAFIALPALSGWQLATLISPIFVYLLLTRISGVRMLEARADKQWKDDPAYQAYKQATPVLALRKPA